MAKETGFLKRKGILKPYEFLVLMTIGQVGMKHPSLAGMVAAIETSISREALHQRFTAPAAVFLYHCLQFVLRQKLLHTSVCSNLLQRFGRVFLVDSSSWDVSGKLRNVLPGSGGSASEANCKIQMAYEYKKGDLIFLDETAGTIPDNRYTDNLPDLLKKNDLLLIDQGYFKLETFIAIMTKGAFFLTRFLIGTTLTDTLTMSPLELGKALSKCRDNTLEIQVTIGKGKKQTQPCRLVCLRINKQMADERRRRLKKQARKKGRQVSKAHLFLCDWTLLITNVPQKWLPLEMVRALYTLRWQIELLFKQLKSVLRVHQSDTANEHRLQCELYGKLISAILIHRIHAAANIALWNFARREISMDKLYKRIQERAFRLAQLFISSTAQAVSLLYRELENLLKHCMKNRQCSRMTTLEMLEIGFDPKIQTGKSPCLA